MTMVRQIVSPLIALMISIAAWWAIGTGFFFDPGLIRYAKTQNDEIVGYWSPQLRFGAMKIEWRTECESELSKIERLARGSYNYTEHPKEVSFFRVSPAIDDCFSDGTPVLMWHRWQAWLFGIVPLRPIEVEYVVAQPPVAIDIEQHIRSQIGDQ